MVNASNLFYTDELYLLRYVALASCENTVTFRYPTTEHRRDILWRLRRASLGITTLNIEVREGWEGLEEKKKIKILMTSWRTCPFIYSLISYLHYYSPLPNTSPSPLSTLISRISTHFQPLQPQPSPLSSNHLSLKLSPVFPRVTPKMGDGSSSSMS